MQKPKPRHLARKATVLALSAVMGISSLSVLAIPAQASMTKNPINTSSREAVSNAYMTRYVPATQSPINWTGSVNGCKPGTVSADSTAKTTQSINFYRGLAGLDSVTTPAKYNVIAQQAALIMEANGYLTHSPPTSATCYTTAGSVGAGSSNLFGGRGGKIVDSVTSVRAYMDDYGESNTFVGHRRWLLTPQTTEMGVGTTNSFNAIKVFGTNTSTTTANPEFMGFPNAGYFPQQLEPNGRWSLSSDKGIDFSASTITVKSGNVALPVKKYPVQNGYGPNTVVFEVSGLKDATGNAESNYTVTVNNMKKAGKVVNYTYTVRLFDGTIKGAPVTTPTPVPTTPAPTTPAPTPTPTKPTPTTPVPTTPVPVPTPTPTKPTPPVVNNPAIRTSADVVTIDSAGKLWNYGTLNAKTATAKKQIGSGWGGFSEIYVTDWNSDGIQDILAKAKAGQLYVYKGNNAGGLSKEIIGNSGWQNYTLAIGKWNKTDKNPSILARDNKTGALYNYGNPSGKGLSARTTVGAGWNGLTFNLLDWDKDGNIDLVAKDSAGKMILYRTNGAGKFVSEARKTIGTGWNGFNSIKTMNGHDGKGTVGILVRDTTGKLHYYPANKGVWGAKKTIGVGWGSFTIAGN